jgi:hypothetical protein
MSKHRAHRIQRLVPGLLLLTAGVLQAQPPSEEEPRWLRLDMPQASVGVDVEGLKENVSANGTTSTHENFLVVPLVGLDLQGSVYHPNLLTFDISGQGGVGWMYDSVTSPGYSSVRNESQNLLLFLATLNFLAGKPYNATFFSSHDHTYYNYDFFNTTTADSTRYGGRVAWVTKAFNLSTDMGYRDLITSGLSGTSEIEETYLNFNGVNLREHGSSTLTYNYDDYANSLNYGPQQTALSQSVGASDSETFGSRGQITATTGGSYGWADYSDRSARTFNANENISAQHLPNLNEFLTLNYQNSVLDPARSSVFQGVAGVRHQLYESLTSTLDVHGTYNDVSSGNVTALYDRYGAGIAESYVKRLGSWGRLTLGGAVIVDHNDQSSSGAGALSVINESHVLKDTTVTFLNNPNVYATTILVTGPGGVPTYANGVDYSIIPHGELTEIRRIPTSLNLSDGATILVSYQSDSLWSGSFESLNGSAQIRLDLFNLVGFYGRINVVDNNAPAQAMAETLTDVIGGADISWRWFRAGAEYEDFDSNFSRYSALRFYESFTYQLGGASQLGLNCNQVFYRYADNQEQRLFQFIGLFNTQISNWLFWNIEGGYYYQDALGVQQNLAAARTGLNFNWGKLSIKAGYQYNYQLLMQTETRDSNFFYVQLKRDF